MPCAAVLAGCAEECAGPPDSLQGTPDFRRKDDRDDEYHGWQDRPDQPGKRRQIHQAGHQGDQQQDEDNAAQQDHGLRIPHEIQHAKENQRHQQDVNDTQPVQALKDKQGVAEKFCHGITGMVFQPASTCFQVCSNEPAF